MQKCFISDSQKPFFGMEETNGHLWGVTNEQVETKASRTQRRKSERRWSEKLSKKQKERSSGCTIMLISHMSETHQHPWFLGSDTGIFTRCQANKIANAAQETRGSFVLSFSAVLLPSQIYQSLKSSAHQSDRGWRHRAGASSLNFPGGDDCAAGQWQQGSKNWRAKAQALFRQPPLSLGMARRAPTSASSCHRGKGDGVVRRLRCEFWMKWLCFLTSDIAAAREPLTVVVAAPCTWLYRLGAASTPTTRPAAHLPSSCSYDFLLLATAETQEPVFKSIATMQF